MLVNLRYHASAKNCKKILQIIYRHNLPNRITIVVNSPPFEYSMRNLDLIFTGDQESFTRDLVVRRRFSAHVLIASFHIWNRAENAAITYNYQDFLNFIISIGGTEIDVL